MKYLLDVFGPFELKFLPSKQGYGKHIEKADVGKFWSNEELSTIKSLTGCYVFAMKVGKGYKPWYVGMAAKSFEQEALSIDKRGKYNQVIFSRKGKPVIYFITNKNLIRRSIPTNALKEVEKFLIQSAHARNGELVNVANTKNTPVWGIDNIIRGNPGKPSGTAATFKTMMNL